MISTASPGASATPSTVPNSMNLEIAGPIASAPSIQRPTPSAPEACNDAVSHSSPSTSTKARPVRAESAAATATEMRRKRNFKLSRLDDGLAEGNRGQTPLRDNSDHRLRHGK